MSINLANEISPRSMPRSVRRKVSQARSISIDELISGPRDARHRDATDTQRTQPITVPSVVNTSEVSIDCNAIIQCANQQSSSLPSDVIDAKGVEFDRFLREHIDMLGYGKDRAITQATIMLVYKTVLRHISTQAPVVGEDIYRQLAPICQMEDWMVMGLCAEITTLRSAQFQFRKPQEPSPSSVPTPKPIPRPSQLYPTPERELGPTVSETFALPASRPNRKIKVRLPPLSSAQASLQDYTWQPQPSVKRSASEIDAHERLEDQPEAKKRRSSSRCSPLDNQRRSPDRTSWQQRYNRYEPPNRYRRRSRAYDLW